jgi:hypothetical protein
MRSRSFSSRSSLVGALPRLGRFPQGSFLRRSWDHHGGMCHNCTFLLVVNETLRTLEGKDGCVATLHLGSKYYNYFKSNFKSQIFLLSLRAVDQGRVHSCEPRARRGTWLLWRLDHPAPEEAACLRYCLSR